MEIYTVIYYHQGNLETCTIGVLNAKSKDAYKGFQGDNKSPYKLPLQVAKRYLCHT